MPGMGHLLTGRTPKEVATLLISQLTAAGIDNVYVEKTYHSRYSGAVESTLSAELNGPSSSALSSSITEALRKADK